MSAITQAPNTQPTPHETLRRLPSHVDLDHLRAVERRAREEIALIEQNARVAARNLHPLEPLPRAQSNVRSVKRTRHWRKQVETILKERILRKEARNRQLDKLIEQEKQKYHSIQQEIAELDKLPDVQPDLVQVHQLTPEDLMRNAIANIQTENENQSPSHQQATDQLLSDMDFDTAFGALTNSLLDCQPFADFPEAGNDGSCDFEPTLNPKFLMSPAPPFAEEFDGLFLFEEDDTV